MAVPNYQAISSDFPPPYFHSTTESRADLPTYHECAPDGSTNAQSTTHESKSTHMHIRIESQTSPFSLPVYGLGATIRGSVKMTGGMNHTERVDVKLEGRIVSDIGRTTRTRLSHKVTVVSTSVCIYDSSASSNGTASDEALRPFEISIPSQQSNGAVLPPTFESALKGATCRVEYSLSVCMIRSVWRSNETVNIPILYLPTSTPTNVPVALADMVRPIINEGYWASSTDNRCTTYMLRPIPVPMPVAGGAALANSTTATSTSSDAIYLTLPSELCFTSGTKIPFILTIACEYNPEITAQMPGYMRVTLFRTIELWVPTRNDKPVMSHETIIGHGEITSSKHHSDGLLTLKGNIVAGEPGCESSWSVQGAANFSYFIRATMLSPPQLKTIFPSVRHEEPCRLVTEPFGSFTISGIPPIALGLKRKLQDVQGAPGTSRIHIPVARASPKISGGTTMGPIGIAGWL